MATSVLFLRHSVRGIPDEIELADGSIVKIQTFSKQTLPLYASPANTTLDGNISGTGWQLSEKLGKLLRTKYNNISIRANVSTDRTVDTAIAIARGANIPYISIYDGPIDPLFFPSDYYNYKLPPTALTEMQARYDNNMNHVNHVSSAITETFGIPLPQDTKITLNNISGLLNIIAKFSQQPNFSVLSNINLGLTKTAMKSISHGAVLHQFINNIPIYTQQQCSNMAQFILNTLMKNDNNTTILIGNDDTISSLASLLDYKFRVPGWPTQFVTANGGFIFTLENNIVTVEFIGLNPHGKYKITKVANPVNINEFKVLIENKINGDYLNLSEIDRVTDCRVY